RQPLTAPTYQGFLRRCWRHGSLPGQALAWSWQHLERHFRDQTKTAEAAGHQPGKFVTGHVLHHLAAETQVLALASDDSGAQYVITYRTGPGAAWPGQSRCHHAADAGGVIEQGRLER